MLFELHGRIRGKNSQAEENGCKVGQRFHIFGVGGYQISSKQNHVRQFVRHRRNNCQGVFEFGTANRNYGMRLISLAEVKTGGPSASLAAPERYSRAECMGLIVENFQVDSTFIDLHVSAHPLE